MPNNLQSRSQISFSPYSTVGKPLVHTSFSNLRELLQWRGQTQPHQKAYYFLSDGIEIESFLTYAQLDRQARAIAAYLQARVSRGERAILLYPSGLDFIKAFFGCLYAGVIAVPAYPPRANRSLNRVKAIVDNAEPKVLLTTKLLLSKLEERISEIEQLKTLSWCATDTLKDDLSNQWQEIPINPDQIAFLQYTSGSTGNPKGVMISHDNLLHNQKMIQTAFGHDEQTIGLGWLPLYHDMGLIGNILQPLYLGFPYYLMSPLIFIHRPLRWLQAISKYRATSSGAPNFAYDLCVQRIKPKQRDSLDLSSWNLAFNGAEAIRAETLQSFSDYFRPCGFRPSAFYPCYGLAEATLFVTGGEKTTKPVITNVESSALQENRINYNPLKNSQQIVSCGETRLGSQLIIVDPQTCTQLLDNQIGEIWLKSKSVAQGYWNSPEESKQTFQAYLKEQPEIPWMRTGDLGFLKDGKLFVTGRLKDMMIVGGRNYYPQDIEFTVTQSHPSLEYSLGAAFTVEVQGEEKLVVIQEVQRKYQNNLIVEEVFKQIRQAVIKEHELQIYRLMLLKTGTIPRTSSGKVQRYLCKQKFLEGSFQLHFP